MYIKIYLLILFRYFFHKPKLLWRISFDPYSFFEIDNFFNLLAVLCINSIYILFYIFSINPEIDIGQVEGAYMMGLGYWLTERFAYDEDSGETLTHNTWVCYKHLITGSYIHYHIL